MEALVLGRGAFWVLIRVLVEGLSWDRRINDMTV